MMPAFYQIYDGVAYDKRAPFLFEYNHVKVHGLALYTVRDPCDQPPDWDRIEHYRIGMVFNMHTRFKFNMYVGGPDASAETVMFNNCAYVHMPGALQPWQHVPLRGCSERVDKVFEFVTLQLIDYYLETAHDNRLYS